MGVRKRREEGPVSPTEFQRTLWEIGDYGTGRDLMELADAAERGLEGLPAGDACEQCGMPTGGLLVCDRCLDERGDCPAL